MISKIIAPDFCCNEIFLWGTAVVIISVTCVWMMLTRFIDAAILKKIKLILVAGENLMFKWLDKIPFSALVVLTLVLGPAPFTPEPHLFEKIRMLIHGQLSRPIDIFDLFLHGTAPVLLGIKIIRQAVLGKGNKKAAGE